MTVNLVMAREDIPPGPSVFLAGPSHADAAQSWRHAAVETLGSAWTGKETLNVLSPESRGGVRAKSYRDQVDWETMARASANAILFWIPRDMTSMPGMTTNVEFGLDVTTGRAVLGCPADCPNPERNRYLIYVAELHGTPVCATLEDTACAAVKIAERAY